MLNEYFVVINEQKDWKFRRNYTEDRMIVAELRSFFAIIEKYFIVIQSQQVDVIFWLAFNILILNEFSSSLK